MDHAPLKSELRKNLITARKALNKEEVQEKSALLFENWRNRFSLDEVSWLHLFKSIAKNKEVDTRYFEDYLRSRHPRINIVVPVVDQVEKTLRHALIGDDIEMVESRFGVPEPKVPVSWVSPLTIDMVLVPLLGFDLEGNRIGYGGGYYDKFLALARPNCIKVGLAFDLSLTKQLVPDAHDVPLDFVVTDTTVYRCNPNLTI